MLGADALNKGSGAALSHCVIDGSIEDIVHNDVGTNTMVALAAWPAKTVNEVDRHLKQCCVRIVVFLLLKH